MSIDRVFGSLSSLALVAALLLPSAAVADTLTVSQWGIGYSTINAAIDDAVDGDIVSVEMGIYSEDVDFDGKNITVISTSGPSVTTILGSYSAVNIDNGESSDAVLDGFTVTGGSFGLYIVSSSPVIRDCVIADNTSYAAYIYHYSNPTFEDCTFEDNSGSYPVYMYYYTEPTFTGCTFQNNSATHGGGMYIDSYNDVTVDSCTFLNNTAGSHGGALYLYYSGLELTNSHFEGNYGYYGTLSINSGTYAPVSVRDNVIFDNDAEYGGAFYIYDTSLYISDNQVVETRPEPPAVPSTWTTTRARPSSTTPWSAPRATARAAASTWRRTTTTCSPTTSSPTPPTARASTRPIPAAACRWCTTTCTTTRTATTAATTATRRAGTATSPWIRPSRPTPSTETWRTTT